MSKIDLDTQRKWDRASPTFEMIAGEGAEKRWRANKTRLFRRMGDGKILFMALGTGLDIVCFPAGKTIDAIDISPGMLKQATARVENYSGKINAQVMDIHHPDFEDETFDQVFTSCTFCSIPKPVEGLKSVHRLLKPGGELLMFEHTGSAYFPFSLMMDIMTPLTRRMGPEMNRKTVDNVRAAGFEVTAVENIFLDVVKIIEARKAPA